MQSILSPLRAMLCVALFTLLVGCTLKDSLIETVEAYYRAQGAFILAAAGKVSGGLVYVVNLLDLREDFEAADELDAIHAKLTEACSPLSDVYAFKFERKEVSGDLEKEAVNAYDLCEEATSEAEGELYRIAPQEADSYTEW